MPEHALRAVDLNDAWTTDEYRTRGHPDPAQFPLGRLLGPAARRRHPDHPASARPRPGVLARQPPRRADPSRAHRHAHGPQRLAGAWPRTRPATRPRGLRRIALAGGARPGRGGTAAGLCRPRRQRGVRRIVWLVQRRAVPSRAEPGAPLSQRPRRLREVGQHLQFRRRRGHPAARDRLAGGRGAGKRQLARTGDRDGVCAGVRRPAAEEHQRQQRRHQPARRPRSSARRPPARHEISSDQSITGRSSTGNRAGLAPDPPRHRRPPDAGDRPHADGGGPARPSLPRPLLRRLSGVRGVSVRPRRRPAERRRLGRRDLRPAARDDSGHRAPGRRQAHPGHLRPVAATRRTWRAAGVDGRRAGRHAGADRAAGRRVRVCDGLAGEHRQTVAGGAAADPAAAAEQGSRHYPGRPHRRHAAASRAGIRLQRPPPDLSRHPAGLLGGRQPVPPPPGHQSPAGGVFAARHGDRA